MYKTNKSAAIREPCGTPLKILSQSEIISP